MSAKQLVNTAWILADRVYIIASTFIVSALVARLLGPDRFGLLSYATSVVALASSIGTLGLYGLVSRYLLEKQVEEMKVMGTVMVMQAVALLLAVAAIALVTTRLLPSTDEELYILAAVALSLVATPFETCSVWFQSRLMSRQVTTASSIANSVASLVRLALVYFKASVVAFGAVVTLETIVRSTIFARRFVKVSGRSFRELRFSMPLARRMLGESWQILLGSVFAVIYLKVDQIMLRWLAGPEEAGIYAVAARLSEASYFVPVAIAASVFPAMMSRRDEGEASLERYMQQLFYVLGLCGICVTAATCLLGPWAIGVAFGPAYEGAQAIIVIHAFAAPFLYMRAVFSRWIILQRLAMFSLVTQGLGAVANVALNALLIPGMGGRGAALATVISYAVAGYLSLLVDARLRTMMRLMTNALVHSWKGVPLVYSEIASHLHRRRA